MSRAQKLRIQELTRLNADLRGQVAGLQGEVRGERRGEYRVAGQLAADIHQCALREEQHRATAARATAAVNRLLHLVAGHVLDVRQGTPLPDALEIFVDDVTMGGFGLRGALISAQIERADSSTRLPAGAAAARAAGQAVVPAP
jgi:hypothetical protein